MSTFARWRAVIGAVLAFGVTVAHADSITFDQAVARAARRPSVAIAGTDVEAARGEADGARRPIYNPEVGVAAGPRFGGGKTLLEVQVSLAQTIELGGKGQARRDAAAARVTAAKPRLALATRGSRCGARFSAPWSADPRGGHGRTEALATQPVAPRATAGAWRRDAAPDQPGQPGGRPRQSRARRRRELLRDRAGRVGHLDRRRARGTARAQRRVAGPSRGDHRRSRHGGARVGGTPRPGGGAR
jgi:hypothetical protein